jgi:hypothetical protein
VKQRPAPSLESRRETDFAAELQQRGRAWIPAWALSETEQDFGKALLAIAARFNSEVAERLDGAGEKMKRGFLDWLAVRGLAALPARMPVVFKLTDTAQAPVPAEHPVRLQVGVQDTSVVFETESDLEIVPGRLDAIVGADPARDAYYLPPPGMSDLGPLASAPAQWHLKSFASPGSMTLQLDPALGLAQGMLIEISKKQYEITAPPKDDLVTIDRPVPGDGFGEGLPVDRVSTFVPFEKATNQQNHVVYLGDTDLFNIEAACTLDVIGGQNLGSDAIWEYFGKVKGSAIPTPADDVPQWRPLARDPNQSKADAVILVKGPGSIEPTQIKAIEARWIRARKASLPSDSAPETADAITVRVNAPPAGPGPASTPPAELSPDVFVNATPSPARSFYPLGREPKLFDTLYVGCAEGFSKSKAKADVYFDLADPSFVALAAINAGSIGGVLASVDVAGALHLFTVGAAGALTPLSGRGPLLPSTSGAAGSGATEDIRLTSNGFRPVMWMAGANLHVVVAAGNSVWDWNETRPAAAGSAWLPLGSLPAPAALNSNIEGLVLVTKGSTQLVALREKRLWIHGVQGSAQWQPLPAKNGSAPLDIVAIAPVVSETAGIVPDTLLAIAPDGANLKLWSVKTDGTVTKLLPDDVSANVVPFAIDRSSGVREVIAVSASKTKLLARQDSNAVVKESLDAGLSVDDTQIDARIESGQITAYCVATMAGAAPRELVAWKPFDASVDAIYRYRPDPAVGIPKGTLVLYGGLALLPGTNQGEILAAAFNGTRNTLGGASLQSALAIRPPLPALAPTDTIVVADANGTLKPLAIEQIDPSDGRGSATGERFVWLDGPLERNASETDIYLFQTSIAAAMWNGTVPATSTPLNPQLELDAGDTMTGMGPILTATVAGPPWTWKIVSINAAIPPGPPRVASLDVKAADPGTAVYYWTPIKFRGRIVPALELTAASNNWPVDVLDRNDVYFPSSQNLAPARQRVVSIAIDSSTQRPLRLAFEEAWSTTPLPAPPVSFVLDTTLAAWTLLLGDSSSNPALAWEYWNGSGWWTLGVTSDTTRNLRQSGFVAFDVPTDLKSTDWSGKTNFWIRARLIGGDYGHETVTVTSTPISGGGTKQVVTRSTEGIQAPFAIRVYVTYLIKDGVLPTYLLTLDSGTLRDQSDANRTPGAQIEMFTPLAVTLSGLEQIASNDRGAPTQCAPDCSCDSGEASRSVLPSPPASAAGGSASGAASSASPGRALYLGFSAALAGAPVNVLLLVDKERPHDALAPLRVDALQADRFVPITISDTTRALGESGLLSMSFSIPSVSRELFGRTLSWLRLMPSRIDPTATWNPGLKGAYLNAVWANATETLTRELVGSSEGAPNLTLQLQRPPVLDGTLELRVREPLGSEERTALNAAEEKRVLSDVENLPGDWVLWKKVTDPGDEDPAARVYALDEDSGTITFGDGKHGMIPPIGRDAIVAFTYQRTEVGTGTTLDVPGNLVTPRTVLNLVSPVESVETVIAADQAAGGAAPETPERVLRFGGARLRHRERALVARDFEDLALESSPKFVQARAFVRPGSVRLVVVKRGPDPVPNAAETRELTRLLLAAAPLWLGVPRALTIDGPPIRQLRVGLVLEVESLDDAGALGIEVKKRVGALFDSATGGIDGDGWPLGIAPREDDIASALVGAPKLVGIVDVTLMEIGSDGTERPLPAAIGADQLVTLAADGIRLDFTIVETLV